MQWPYRNTLGFVEQPCCGGGVLLPATTRAAPLRPARLFRILTVGLLAAAVAGCAGRGAVEFASLDLAAIDPPPPHVQRITFEKVFWYVEEADGTLRLALDKDAPSLLGEIGRVRVQISLRLEKLPAGPTRQYPLRTNEMRCRIRVGAAESRLLSATGMAAIDRVDGRRLRGQFRLIATRRTLGLLGGWVNGPRALLLGEFEAVSGRDQCKAIYAATEENDFARPPIAPTSQPAN